MSGGVGIAVLIGNDYIEVYRVPRKVLDSLPDAVDKDDVDEVAEMIKRLGEFVERIKVDYHLFIDLEW